MNYLVSINSTRRLTDHLGSVDVVLNNAGAVLSQQRYLPFGEERTNIGNITQTDFRFTGQRDLDPGMGGLMDYRARMYLPALGRFLQPDTIIPSPANPQAFNRYSYVLNNPVNFNDPTGHMCSDPEDKWSPFCEGSDRVGTKVGDIIIRGNGGGHGNHRKEDDGDKVARGSGDNGQAVTLLESPLLLPDDLLSVGGQEVCEFATHDKMACNPDNWNAFGNYLESLPDSFGYDPFKIDGIEMLIDMGGIVTDAGSFLAPSLAFKFQQAGLTIDVIGANYEVYKATEGGSNLLDIGFKGIGKIAKTSYVTKARFGRAVPLVGILGNIVSMGANFSGGFYQKLSITIGD